MTKALFLTTFLISFFAYTELFGQQIQLNGMLKNMSSQSTDILIFSDGEMVGFSSTADPFYSLILGDHPHYTILFKSGSTEKYCLVIMSNMSTSTIQLDVDFRNQQSIILFKDRPRAKHYELIKYGVGSFRYESFNPASIE
jgi:hypothetical protein